MLQHPASRSPSVSPPKSSPLFPWTQGECPSAIAIKHLICRCSLEPVGARSECHESLVVEIDWEVSVAGSLDDPADDGPPPEIDQTEPQSSPQPPSKLTTQQQQIVNLYTVREIRQDALSEALELYEDANPEATTAELCEVRRGGGCLLALSRMASGVGSRNITDTQFWFSRAQVNTHKQHQQT